MKPPGAFPPHALLPTGRSSARLSRFLSLQLPTHSPRPHRPSPAGSSAAGSPSRGARPTPTRRALSCPRDADSLCWTRGASSCGTGTRYFCMPGGGINSSFCGVRGRWRWLFARPAAELLSSSPPFPAGTSWSSSSFSTPLSSLPSRCASLLPRFSSLQATRTPHSAPFPRSGQMEPLVVRIRESERASLASFCPLGPH